MQDELISLDCLGFSINKDPFSGKPADPEYLINLSRHLRLNMTECEKILWEKLKKRQLDGLRFRRQHIVGRYIVDFFCHEKKLVIEVEGSVHDLQQEYDKNRFNVINKFGLYVLRVKNNEVKNNINNVLEKIKKVAHSYPNSSKSPPLIMPTGISYSLFSL